MVECTPIGTVRTPIATTDDAPRQGMHEDIEGTVEVREEYVDGLAGFEPGTEMVVVWFADRADRSLLRADKRDGRGVFATRSPARPNPICLTTVEVLAIDGGTVSVRGVDMLDGSPVLDIKVPLE
ncbi:MAG: tRNA (N6-threonylcarbamoyladenosine(37)-N6)-methyltransferase TrmO [Halanaeroarchaeum sp.]